MNRKIRLVTSCDRAPNYLMNIAVKCWLRVFESSELIFLVNNITGFDMVQSLKELYNIDAKRVYNLEEASTTDGCLVWDYTSCKNYSEFLNLDRDMINNLQESLLNNGTDVVVFLDRDEILYHKDLRKLLNEFSEPVIRPRGIEIIQIGTENELDETKPIHEQRSYVRYYSSKSKPCITKQPIKWQTGRHLTMCGTYPHGDIAGPRAEYPGLYLIHIDKIDINLLYQLRLEGDEIFNGFGYGSEKTDPTKFSEWFTEAQRNQELYEDNKFLKEINF